MSLSPKQAKAHRRSIQGDIDRDLRMKAKDKVRALWKGVRAKHAAKKVTLHEIATLCRNERLSLGERLRANRLRVMVDLAETGRVEREAARALCQLRRGEAKGTCNDAVACARKEHVAEKAYQADLKRIERGNRSKLRAHHKASRAERRSESDDQVRANIPVELVPLFERVKRGIKGDLHQSRTEAFLHYAETHPHEVFEVIEDKTDALIREMEQRQGAGSTSGARGGRQLRKTKAPRGPQFTPEELAAVPF